MQAKILKNIIYKGAIRSAGSQHEIDDVTFYVLQKRGMVEAVNKLEEASLPTFDEVMRGKK